MVRQHLSAPRTEDGDLARAARQDGTGKTKVGEVFGSLLGRHYVPVSDPRYVTGRFNSHLVSCLLLHCDKAFWAGDRAAEGKLKDLITGQFAVLEIGEVHMQDKAYFAAIDEQMDNGGREALLDHLMRFDMKSVDLRTIPKTTALLDQKISTLNPMQGWWLDTLMRGDLPGLLPDESPEGCSTCFVSSIFDLYLNHAQKQGVRRRSLEVQIGIFLHKLVPGLRGRERVTEDSRDYVYDFPPLATCRKAFAESLQQDIKWTVKVGWAEWPTSGGGKFI